MCGKSSAKFCSQCRTSSYCSTVCQRKDFPAHKLLCKQFDTRGARHSPEYRRAILFPDKEDKARLIRVRCNTIPLTEWTETIRVGTNPHLENGDPKRDIAWITYNPVRDLHLGADYERLRPMPGGYCAALISRKESLIDGSNANKSLITATKSYDGAHVDITLEDCLDLIDHLVTQWAPTALPEVGEIAAEEGATKAAASRGLPLGMVPKGLMQFDRLDFLPEDRRNLAPGSLSPLSQLIRMPIRLWKPPMSGFRDTNVQAAYLNIDLDPARLIFGWAPPYWKTNVGQVVAVREDGKDLTKRDISMLCHYATDRMQPAVEVVLESGLVARQRVVGRLNREDMEKFWRQTGWMT